MGFQRRKRGPDLLTADLTLDQLRASHLDFSLQPFIHLRKPDIGLRLSDNSTVGKAQILAPE